MASPSTSARRPAFSIFTHSVGAHLAGHALPDKLRAIAAAGFQGVEIFQDDLDAYGRSDEFAGLYKSLTPPASPHYTPREMTLGEGCSSGSEPRPVDVPKTAYNAHGACTAYERQREIVCASYVGGLCASLGLRVYSLQPMRDVEGWRSAAKRKEACERVRSRFAVLRALQTDLLLCCSNCQPHDELTDDVAQMADDFRALADEARAYDNHDGQLGPLRIAFEGLSWGTRIDTWAQAYDVVRRVDRANFGLCLDSFNTLGREYADPCAASGVQEPQAATHARLAQSIEAIKAVPTDKVFFLQIGDARKPLQGPLEPSPNADEPRPARMIWSRANRLFPGEQQRGAYLPVVPFTKAALATGYDGPWSIEVFNQSLSDQGLAVQSEHAERAFKGLQWLVEQAL